MPEIRELHDDEEGAFSVRVPRDLLPILAIDTARRPQPAELDLRGATDSDRVVDIYLEL